MAHFFSNTARVNTLPLNPDFNPLQDDNPIPNNIFALAKFKAFPEDNLNVAKIIIAVLDRVDNVGKEENAGNQHFLKATSCRSFEQRIVW